MIFQYAHFPRLGGTGHPRLAVDLDKNTANLGALSRLSGDDEVSSYHLATIIDLTRYICHSHFNLSLLASLWWRKQATPR